ncbi:MAG: lipopolysaccharide biosynthesis protein [Candidatus Sulfotelmatobacter sp.]
MNQPADPTLAIASESLDECVSEPMPALGNPLDRSLARSVAWNAASDWGTQIFTWLAFLEVMRLLTPADFGVAALAIILMPYLGQITGFGIPRAVVALPPLSDDQLSQLTTFNLISGCLCFLLGVIIAKPFAAFFRTPALAPVFIVACGGLILSALSGVPGALLAKEMRFRLLSVLGVTTTLLGAAVTLGMALSGFGYWALILGNMFAGFVRTVVILRVRPCKLAWPRLRSIREPLRFGWQMSVSLVALNSYERLDNFVAGRMLGQSALGLYGNAWELANVPLEKIASMVTTVIPTYLAAVQNDPAELRRYLRGLTEIIALAAFPACIGLGLVAREFVPLIFGHKWDGMIAPLQVLSFYAAFRSIVALLPKVLTAVGNIRYVMWNDLVALIILPIAFYIGSSRGIAGIAWGWVAAYPVVILPLYWKTFRTIEMKTGDYLRALRPALSGTIAMIPAVEWLKYRLPPARPLLLRLILEVAVGAFVYLGILRLLHGERVLAIIQTAKYLRPGKVRLPGTSVETKRSASDRPKD